MLRYVHNYAARSAQYMYRIRIFYYGLLIGFPCILVELAWWFLGRSELKTLKLAWDEHLNNPKFNLELGLAGGYWHGNFCSSQVVYKLGRDRESAINI